MPGGILFEYLFEFLNMSPIIGFVVFVFFSANTFSVSKNALDRSQCILKHCEHVS